jgi:hypothetical protein
MENNTKVLQKLKTEQTFHLITQSLGIYLKEIKSKAC